MTLNKVTPILEKVELPVIVGSKKAERVWILERIQTPNKVAEWWEPKNPSNPLSWYPKSLIANEISCEPRKGNESSVKNRSFIAPQYESHIIFHVSAGLCKIRNARKKQSLVVSKLVQSFVEQTPVQCMDVEVSGFNKNRQLLIDTLSRSKRISIMRLTDMTKLPHNGCRRPKKRRL